MSDQNPRRPAAKRSTEQKKPFVPAGKNAKHAALAAERERKQLLGADGVGKRKGGKQSPRTTTDASSMQAARPRGGSKTRAANASQTAHIHGSTEINRTSASASPPSGGTRKPALPALKKTAASRTFAVSEAGELLPFLLGQLTKEGRNAVKGMLARGQVSVDGLAVTAYNFPLQPGQTVAVGKVGTAKAVRFTGLTILHEDEDVIVIRKDTGLLSVSTETEKELTAYRQLSDYVKMADPKARIFVLHRLDRDTSGVMMFAKSEAVQRKMQDEWKDVVKERTYVALVEGTVAKAEDTISSWLKENAAMKVYSSPTPEDGQHAVTHYKTLEAGKHYSLLEVRLETGRKNQIRVHMQDIGHPIAGDKKYGALTKPIGRLGLHARILSFEHPRTGELMRFDAGVPQSFRTALR